jgi:two-component system, OmpR family, sensor histidine kinase KdpD
LAALLSFLSFNFFLVKPLYTLIVADTREVLDLLVFLVVAVLGGQLAANAREQAERAARSREFEEADRLKTALLHAVSHDFRTPITIIKTSASNLRNLYKQLTPEERRETLETIDGEADHLNRMVGNLLDLSRLQAGALTLHLALNSLEEVAGDAAARAWQLTREERVRLNFPDDLPLAPFDYGLMLQALSNLVDNALRYEPPGSQVEIRGGVSQNALSRSKGVDAGPKNDPGSDEIQVAVINHGPTITPEEREHIMEPFYHGKDGHVGLGLPIAKGIVEAHRGRLVLEDTPGGGATFIIALPLDMKEVSYEDTRRR